MTCDEFEIGWDDLLDARDGAPAELASDLEARASTCHDCRLASSGYGTLRLALASWPPLPIPSPGSLERLRALTVPERNAFHRFRRHPRIRRLAPWAASAVAAALLGFSWMGGPSRLARTWFEPVDTPGLPPLVVRHEPSRPLRLALAEATEATLDLARQASAPAARIGREVFDFETRPIALSTRTTTDNGSNASDLLQTVGDRVNAGVKPMAGSARHAFSFLLGPPPESSTVPDKSQGSL